MDYLTFISDGLDTDPLGAGCRQLDRQSYRIGKDPTCRRVGVGLERLDNCAGAQVRTITRNYMNL